MAKGKNKSTKSNKDPQKRAVGQSRRGSSIVIVVVAVIVTGVVFWANKPKTKEKVDLSKPESPKTESSSVPWEPEEESKVFPKYAGSESCRQCHADQFGLWQGSHHQLAERLPEPAMDGGAFEPKREFKHPAVRRLQKIMGLAAKFFEFALEHRPPRDLASVFNLLHKAHGAVAACTLHGLHNGHALVSSVLLSRCTAALTSEGNECAGKRVRLRALMILLST